MYPTIEPKRLTGEELLLAPNGKPISSLSAFWQWAYSDLIGNAERGALAEYIVACALGVHNNIRVSWDKYDLVTPEGITVEVKTSGYLQTWEQKELSKPVFGIQQTYGWDSRTNTYDTVQKRQAQVYVFCLHKHTHQETLNPLLISQWEFYVVPTDLLNNKFGQQKKVTLSALIATGAKRCSFDSLHSTVVATAENG